MKQILDYTALLHCALMKKGFINSFRFSVVMKEKIDTVALQKAVNLTIDRYPLICSKIHKGFFWQYVESLDELIVEEDKDCVFSAIDHESVYQKAISVLYKENTITIEVFHSITDGTGAITFLKELVTQYVHLKQPMGKARIFTENHDFSDSYSTIEPKDFENNHKAKKKNLFRFSKRSDSTPIRIQKYLIHLDELKEACKENDCRINELILALFYKAIEEVKEEKSKNICIMAPVNLRQHFKSKTLRNFSYYTSIMFNQECEHLPYPKLSEVVRIQMNKQNTKEHLGYELARITRLYKNPILQIIPLGVKNFVIRLIYGFVGEKTCMTISNLGLIRFEDPMVEAQMERFEVELAPRYNTPINCGVITANNQLVISVTHDGLNQKLLASIERELRKLNIRYLSMS